MRGRGSKPFWPFQLHLGMPLRPARPPRRGTVQPTNLDPHSMHSPMDPISFFGPRAIKIRLTHSQFVKEMRPHFFRRSTLICCRRTSISASSSALDLKSEAKTPRISLSTSVIRPRAYPVHSLRLCRIEFSVHTGERRL